MNSLYHKLKQLNASGLDLSQYLAVSNNSAHQLIEAWEVIEQTNSIKLNDHNKMLIFHLTEGFQNETLLRKSRNRLLNSAKYKFSKEEISRYINLERTLYNHVMMIDFGETLSDQTYLNNLSPDVAKDCLERGKVIVSLSPSNETEMFYKFKNATYNSKLNTVNFSLMTEDCTLSLTNKENNEQAKFFIEKILKLTYD